MSGAARARRRVACGLLPCLLPCLLSCLLPCLLTCAPWGQPSHSRAARAEPPPAAALDAEGAEGAEGEAEGEPWLTAGALLTTEGAALLTPPRAPGAPSAELRHLAQLSVAVDLKGATLDLGRVVAQGLGVREDRDVQGGNPALGDLHAYSNMRAEDRLELFELFWERALGPALVRVWKVDANDHFAVSEHEAHLINGAAGYSPSVFGMPSYPDSAWCAQAGFTSTRVDGLAGVFDGGATELSPTPTGARLWLSPAAGRGGLFYAAQLTLHLGALHTQEELAPNERAAPTQSDRGFQARAPYHVTAGAWAHRGRVTPNPAAPDDPARGLPSWGVYATSDFTLGALRGGEVGLGLQGALSPAYHPLHLSAALTWDDALAPLAGAPAGLSLALGLSHLSVADALAESLGVGATEEELAELTATLPVREWLTVSLSAVYLRGAHLGAGGEAAALVGRVTVGGGELFVVDAGLGARPGRAP